MALTERERRIREAFSFTTDEAFELWVEQGCPIFDGAPDSPELLWDEGGYRIRTDEDRRLAREAAERQRQRFENDEMDPFERLMYLTVQHTQKYALDALFSAKPLMYHVLDEDES